MKYIIKICLRTLLSLLVVAGTQRIHAQTTPEVETRGNANSPISLRLDLRLRYTSIEESNKPQNVDVTTVRIVPGIEAKLSPNLTLTIDAIHTDFIGAKRFNDNPSVPSPFPLLPDPRYTGLNQVTLAWAPTSYLDIIAGRQSVKMGNERHVSDNNFRQVPQMFDGVLTRWTPFNSASVVAGYFPQRRTFFGKVEPAKLGVFELALNPVENVSTSLYAVRHQPDASFSNAFLYGVNDYSNVTVGGTADASVNVGSTRLTLATELARQRAVAGGSPLISANYYRLGLGATMAGWTARVDHENRASNEGRYAFQTVLSDYYAYNGNSLVFFATPKDGLRDTWATLRYERGRFSMLHEYHWFRSDVGGKDYGRELDLNFTYNWSERWYMRAQWAHYRPELPRAVDVDKVWLTLGYLLR